jgi:alpha-tubulin suppressor-like RCC1 family protein
VLKTKGGIMKKWPVKLSVIFIIAVLYSNSLSAATPDYYDLKAYQTSVKDQDWRGFCGPFSIVGALEAAYVRKYGLNGNNLNTPDGLEKYRKYGIAGEQACKTIDNCEEFDLSEEYYLHAAISIQHAYNWDSLDPPLQYENLPSTWTYLPILGGYINATESITLPKEKYAPYFGGVNQWSSIYPGHNNEDLYSIALQSGIAIPDPMGGPVPVLNPNRTQKNVDDFEYDTRHIPLEARKNAIYGATRVKILSPAEAQSISFIETEIATDHEVQVSFDRHNLCCDGVPPSPIDGNPACNYCEPSGPTWEGGHYVLLIGYDHSGRYFLAKNSWGKNNRPYLWISYEFIQRRADGGAIILDIRDPELGPSKESLWLGKWKMDIDGQQGELVLRRTREIYESGAPGNTYTDNTTGTTARLGTYYSQDGIAHKVTGHSAGGSLYLAIDFDHVEGPSSDPKGTVVTEQGQWFTLNMFSSPQNAFTHGNFASGFTKWGTTFYGVLASRPQITLKHTPGTFVQGKWNDTFKMYYQDGTTAILDVDCTTNCNYSNIRYNRIGYWEVAGDYALIQDHRLRIDSGAEFFYHTWETGIFSGAEGFGIRTSDLLTQGMVAAGGGHSLALKPDGTLWGWGLNQSCQLGDGTYSDKLSVSQIGTDTDWLTVSAGDGYSLGIKSNGTLWGWGFNWYGQVGDGTTMVDRLTPVQIGVDNRWVAISTGNRHSLGLKADGTLWAWGANEYGQLGDGTTTNKSVPVQVGTDNHWLTIAAGDSHSLGTKTDGTLWAWGKNSDAGQLGDGSYIDQLTPIQVGTDAKWVAVSAGGWHSLGLKSDGTLWAWGYNAYGQLGDGTRVDKATPVQIDAKNAWVAISSGSRHSLGLTAFGTLRAWGLNGYGQLGNGTLVDRLVPAQTGTLDNWVTISAGEAHSLGLTSDGIMWSWGWNRYGQIGDGTGWNDVMYRTSPTVPQETCSATVSNDGILHIPMVSYGNSYWIDLQSVPTRDGTILLKLINYGYSSSGNCAAATVSYNSTSNTYILYVPSVIVGSRYYWSNLLYVPTSDVTMLFQVYLTGLIF